MTYYHGTNSHNLEGIMEEGLRTDRCGENYSASHGQEENSCPVFLTYGSRRAEYWAQSHEITDSDGKQSPVVLAINSSCVDEDKLKDDPRPAVNKGDLEYPESIDAKCITRHEPEEDNTRKCATAFEEVKEAETELRRNDTPENFQEFESKADKFRNVCGMRYQGDEL